MDTVKTYPCPCCGASLGYDGSSKSLHCASCGNDYTPETLQRRVMEQAEWKLLPRATELVCRAITEEEN